MHNFDSDDCENRLKTPGTIVEKSPEIRSLPKKKSDFVFYKYIQMLSINQIKPNLHMI